MKKRFLSTLLALCMVLSMLPAAVFATGDTAVSALITGVSVTVDGVTVDSTIGGSLTITSTSTVIYTVSGTDFANLSTNNILIPDGASTFLTPEYGFAVDTEANTATYDYAGDTSWFESCDNFEVRYTNDGGSTWIGTGIYLTYDDGLSEEEKAQITGVSVTVDGVTVDSTTGGSLTITPTSTVIYTVRGTDFANLSTNNMLAPDGTSTFLTPEYGFMVDTEANTAAFDYSGYTSWFVSCDNFEVKYSNDGGSTWIGTGIYLTYDDGLSEEEKAQITGVSITVDGVTYTEGEVIITPNSTVVYTVIGINFANLKTDILLGYVTGSSVSVTADEGFTIDTVEGIATQDFSRFISQFEGCDNDEIPYSNDGGITWTGTGIYLTYVEEAPALEFINSPGLSFQEYIGIQVMISDSLTEYYDEIYVESVQSTPDGDVKTRLEGIAYAAEYLIFSHKILSWSMTENVTLTLCATKNGEVITGQVITGTVERLALAKLPDYADSGRAAMCRVLVDMLNYGAAVQLSYNYNVESLPNTRLGEYAVYGSTEAPTLSASNSITGEGSIRIYRDNISLQDQVEIQLMVKTADLEGMTVRAVLNSEAAEVTATEYGAYTILRVAVKAACMRDTYTIGIYDADGNPAAAVYNVSVEGYAVNKMSGNRADVITAMMRYGDAVAAIA